MTAKHTLGIYLVIGILFIASCTESKKDIVKKDSEVMMVDTLSSNQKWMKAINEKDIELLSSLYVENALVLSKNGVDLASRKEILELVPNSDFIVKGVSTIKIIEANNQYDYEIGSFKNKDNGEMKHLIIWKTSEEKNLRELEFLAEATSTDLNLEEINAARKRWIALCNAHDAKSLIETMYSKNTMYYNRGRLLKGRSELTAEYAYMNSSNYSLTLNPILVEPVSNSIVYEFGQCEGSYNGKYILVWQKNEDGVWQILFDSNI